MRGVASNVPSVRSDPPQRNLKGTFTNHGQPRINTYHHPEKLLRKQEEDDEP